MLLRRMLAGGLVVALLAPLVGGAISGGSQTAAQGASGGGSCCVAMPCCETGGSCATGTCEKPATKGAPIPSHASRLSAGCPGSAPATPAADRDPMVAALHFITPAPRPPAVALPFFAWIAPERTTDPTDPPPRV